jgi:hypothetical protein
MADLAILFREVGLYGLLLAVGFDLVFILCVTTAWKLGFPLNDQKSKVLRISMHLSQPPRKLWSFQRGVGRARSFLMKALVRRPPKR